MKGLAAFLGAVLILPVCLEAASKARLYKLSTGEVVFEYTNKW